MIKKLFEVIPNISGFHQPGCGLHNFIQEAIRPEVARMKATGSIDFGPFGNLIFPYHSMGNINSLNLFELDEIFLFSYYWESRKRYKRVLDLGANLGLHTVLLAKCGYDVTCLEPVKEHYDVLLQNIEDNNIKSVKALNAAVSDKDGEAEFIIVRGNTTGSHIAGSKANPYGELETCKVPLMAFEALVEGIDLVKMDVEGHEKEIICKSNPQLWQNVDMMLSIHDIENARQIFNYFSEHDINMYSQKINWGRVQSYDDMIVTHHDGSLFVSSGDMHWGN